MGVLRLLTALRKSRFSWINGNRKERQVESHGLTAQTDHGDVDPVAGGHGAVGSQGRAGNDVRNADSSGGRGRHAIEKTAAIKHKAGLLSGTGGCLAVVQWSSTQMISLFSNAA
jgi:hypothetical protein